VQLTYKWVVNEDLDTDYHCFVHFTNAAGKGPDDIEFQQDHDVPKPTSQWRKGDVILDGPYTITVPDGKLDSYDIVIGLHKGSRVALKGPDGGGSRILIGRLQVKREGEKAVAVTLGDISAAVAAGEKRQVDFSAHLNPAGTWVDFGKAATDGSVKINREKGRLVLFPYPRNKAFRVSLDLKALAPGAAPARVQVHALAALTGFDQGTVESRVEGTRLTFTAGKPGAGRYVVTW